MQAKENELFFAEFPHEIVGLERIDKYTLREWLIGYATIHGWEWAQSERLTGTLSKLWPDGIRSIVIVTIESGGLTLECGDRHELIETKW